MIRCDMCRFAHAVRSDDGRDVIHYECRKDEKKQGESYPRAVRPCGGFVQKDEKR